MADYEKIGLLVMLGGRMLLCRKSRGTSLLILPGGCIEAGETPMQCLAREVREELGDVSVQNVEYVGTYEDRAAGEDGKTVRIDLYRGELAGRPAASAEIAELVWFGEDDDREQLSPSIRNKVLPDLVKRGFIEWRR